MQTSHSWELERGHVWLRRSRVFSWLQIWGKKYLVFHFCAGWKGRGAGGTRRGRILPQERKPKTITPRESDIFGKVAAAGMRLLAASDKEELCWDREWLFFTLPPGSHQGWHPTLVFVLILGEEWLRFPGRWVCSTVPPHVPSHVVLAQQPDPISIPTSPHQP